MLRKTTVYGGGMMLLTSYSASGPPEARGWTLWKQNPRLNGPLIEPPEFSLCI